MRHSVPRVARCAAHDLSERGVELAEAVIAAGAGNLEHALVGFGEKPAGMTDAQAHEVLIGCLPGVVLEQGMEPAWLEPYPPCEALPGDGGGGRLRHLIGWVDRQAKFVCPPVVHIPRNRPCPHPVFNDRK